MMSHIEKSYGGLHILNLFYGYCGKDTRLSGDPSKFENAHT